MRPARPNGGGRPAQDLQFRGHVDDRGFNGGAAYGGDFFATRLTDANDNTVLFTGDFLTAGDVDLIPTYSAS